MLLPPLSRQNDCYLTKRSEAEDVRPVAESVHLKSSLPLIFLFCLAFLLGLASPASAGSPRSTFRTHLPASFLARCDALLAQYFLLKDALVADNTWGASMAASRMLLSASTLDVQGLQPKHLALWTAFHKATRAPMDQISGASNIEVQRQHFKPLSTAFIQATAYIGAGPWHIYRHHCPMADQGRGADWLSLHSVIQNPYYGVQMLACGKNVASYQGQTSAAPLPIGTLPGTQQYPIMHGCHGQGR